MGNSNVWVLPTNGNSSVFQTFTIPNPTITLGTGHRVGYQSPKPMSISSKPNLDNIEFCEGNEFEKKTGKKKEKFRISGIVGQVYFLSKVGTGELIKTPVSETELRTKYTLISARRWQPKPGENYFGIDLDGDVFQREWDGSSSDKVLFAAGNCARTPEGAKKYFEDLKEWAKNRETLFLN